MMSLQLFLQSRTSKQEIEDMVNHVSKSPSEIPHLITGMQSGDYRANQQAGWVIGKLGELAPELLTPYTGELLELLEMPKIDGVHRNIWRATQFMTIPEEHKGRMLDVGFTHFEDRSAKVAIRMFALKTITPLVEEHPELMEEIRAIIEYSWEGSTAGFKSITRNTLKKWDRKYS